METMGWKRYGNPTSYDDERLVQEILQGEQELTRGITAERFAMKLQRALRELGGTQADAERLAEITDDGGAGEEKPVTAYMRAQAEKLLTQVMARAQERELVGVAA